MASIVIVEEDHELRSALARDLVLQGHHVSLAASRQAAIPLLGGSGTHAVVAGLSLLDIESLLGLGVPARRWIAALPTIADEGAARLKRLGCTLLLKPFTPQALAEAVAAVTTGHGTASTELVDQLLGYHRQGKSVRLTNALGTAVYMDEGELVHASAPSCEGPAALAEFLSQAGAAIVIDHFVPDRHSLGGTFMSSVLTALRALEGAQRRLGGR